MAIVFIVFFLGIYVGWKLNGWFHANFQPLTPDDSAGDGRRTESQTDPSSSNRDDTGNINATRDVPSQSESSTRGDTGTSARSTESRAEHTSDRPLRQRNVFRDMPAQRSYPVCGDGIDVMAIRRRLNLTRGPHSSTRRLLVAPSIPPAERAQRVSESSFLRVEDGIMIQDQGTQVCHTGPLQDYTVEGLNRLLSRFHLKPGGMTKNEVIQFLEEFFREVDNAED